MKAKNSFFNFGLSRNLFKRCWPLWMGYFAAVLLLLPVGLSSHLKNYMDTPTLAEDLSRLVFNEGADVAVLSFVTCIIAVMLMFSYLYNPKSCGMMNALPLRRETLFITAFRTGLMPLIIADILSFLMAAEIFGSYGCMEALWTWLLMSVLCNLTFYGIAAFCAVLTGSLIILPALYVVLNFTAYLAVNAVQALLKIFVYGFNTAGSVFEKFSPIFGLVTELHCYTSGLPEDTGYHMNGLGLLAIYAVAGLALAAAALLIYRRRQMETASDTVAVSVLKPIFRYCMCFGAALVFAAVIYNWFFDRMFSGFGAAAFAFALMLIGGFIGYFAAEMLMQKTVWVFCGKWKGYFISCFALAVFTLVFELDAFGYERYIPDGEQVSAVFLSAEDGATLKEPENIALARELHRSLIDHKAENEASYETRSIYIRYILKDGRSVERLYQLAAGEAEMAGADSDIALAEQVFNASEAILQRSNAAIPIAARNISYCSVNCSYTDDTGRFQNFQLELDVNQAEELFNQCILPDLKDGTLGLYYFYGSAGYFADMSNTDISFELRDASSPDGETRYDYQSFNVTMGAKRTCAWAREHCGEAFMSVADAEGKDILYDEKYMQ